MSDFNPSEKTRVVRSHKRGSYSRSDLYDVLDAGYLCHVAYMFEDAPIIIPTAYARQGDTVYIHGALKNRMMRSLLEQQRATVAVTHSDGMVLARSAFHHSFNYRSAVVFGKPREVTNKDAKNDVLRMITENILPGRWEEVRQPSDKELDITLVVAIDIEEASIKQRTGGPVDDEDDYVLPIWAGVLPTKTVFGKPIPDEKMTEKLQTPNSVLKAKHK